MSLRVVHVSTTQDVLFPIPVDLWQAILAATPKDQSAQQTIIDFMELYLLRDQHQLGASDVEQALAPADEEAGECSR